jgi:hypothetical protein
MIGIGMPTIQSNAERIEYPSLLSDHNVPEKTSFHSRAAIPLQQGLEKFIANSCWKAAEHIVRAPGPSIRIECLFVDGAALRLSHHQPHLILPSLYRSCLRPELGVS